MGVSEQPPRESDKQMMAFYKVSSLYGVIDAQTEQIKNLHRKLQAKQNSTPAAPASASEAPVAVPLTDEDLRNALRQCPHDAVENLRVRWLYATDFAREIERECAARWGVKLEGGQE
jgi:hypothetical protein